MMKYNNFDPSGLSPVGQRYRPPSMIGPNYFGNVFYNPSSGFYGTGSMYGAHSSYNTINNLYITGPSPMNYQFDEQFGKIDQGKW